MKYTHRYLSALLLLVAAVMAVDLVRNRMAMATSNAIILDKQVCTTTVVSGGGTATCSYALAADKAYHLTADVGLSQLDAGHLWGVGGFGCDAVFESNNTTLATATAIGQTPNFGSNPMAAIGTSTSNPYMRTGRAEANDSVFTNTGSGATSNCAWTTSGSNAVLTITNNGTSGTADVTVYITAFVFGSH